MTNPSKPKSTTTARSSADVLAELNKVPEEMRVFWVNYLNAIEVRRGLREMAVHQCLSWKGGSTTHNQNQQITQLMAFQNSEHASRLASSEAIVAAMEGHSYLKKAETTVKPLLAALAEAQEELKLIKESATTMLATTNKNKELLALMDNKSHKNVQEELSKGRAELILKY